MKFTYIRILSPYGVLITALLLLLSNNGIGQGLNHNWLLGYTTGVDSNVISRRAIFEFDQSSINVIPTNFKMAFLAGQSNISDSSGNLLFSTNGCWIADATMDTMQNGSGLNPNAFTSNWCTSGSGIPYPHSSIVLPYPDDVSKYVLLHLTGSNGTTNFMALSLYYSVIDMNANGGLGSVITKNVVAISDTLNPGITACKHANGRDWWIVVLKDSTDLAYKVLLTPTGISSITTQSLGMPPHNHFNNQLGFSPDGKKFAYHYYYGNLAQSTHEIRIFNFDRCTGVFSNGTIVTAIEPYQGLGLAFSSNSKYLYFNTFFKIFQINTDTINMQASLQIVALNDFYYSPFPPFLTDFWLMYLAANGKIYISSGNSVIDMHYINYPDSAGLACDVQQHALHLPSWSGRGHVNHPNYYLGCDTTLGCPCLVTGMETIPDHDFRLKISPNPTSGIFKIIYLLPQNQSGQLSIFDLSGKAVYSMQLPPWSTLQNISLPDLPQGVYFCHILSGKNYSYEKLVIIE